MVVKLVSDWVLPFGYGIYLPFNIILVRKNSRNIPYQIAHEMTHHRQRKCYCCYASWFMRYLWLLLKYGYNKHPMEVEARAQGLLNQIEYSNYAKVD